LSSPARPDLQATNASRQDQRHWHSPQSSKPRPLHFPSAGSTVHISCPCETRLLPTESPSLPTRATRSGVESKERETQVSRFQVLMGTSVAMFGGLGLDITATEVLMDDRRDTRRSSCCVCSDRHQFGLPGVPREHDSRACRRVEITRRGRPFVLGRQMLRRARVGTNRLVFFLCFPTRPLSEKLPLRVYTNC